MASVFKALADSTRRQVLQLLRDGPRTAGELAGAFDVSRPTMSAHFTVLREAGLVESIKDGKTVVYHINLSVLEEALLAFTRPLGFELRGPRRAAAERADATRPREQD